MQIISNNRARPLLSGYELPASARAAFDYMSDEQFECASFVRYKGHFYDLGEFMNIRGSTDLQGGTAILTTPIFPACWLNSAQMIMIGLLWADIIRDLSLPRACTWAALNYDRELKCDKCKRYGNLARLILP